MENQPKKKKYAISGAKKSSRQYPVRLFPRNSGLVGLQNLGNTCYMNAALQALSNCPQLTTYMLEHFEQIKPGLAKNFALLLYEIWVHSWPEYEGQTNHKVFYDYRTPDAILFGIKRACPNFRSSAQQEDAQEFLRCFLDQMHEELKAPVNKVALISDENSSASLSNSETDDQPLVNHDLIDLNSFSSNEELSHGDAHRSAASSHHQEPDHRSPNANGHPVSNNNIFCQMNGDEPVHSAPNHSNESTGSIDHEPSGKETLKQFLSNNPMNDAPDDALSSRSPAGRMDSSVNNLFGNSINNYPLTEHSQITPGLGDANDEHLNGMEYEKENDPNMPNDPSKSNGLNGDPHGEIIRVENLRRADFHSSHLCPLLNGFANDHLQEEEEDLIEDAKMQDWELLVRREDPKPSSCFETDRIDKRQLASDDAARLPEPQMNEHPDDRPIESRPGEVRLSYSQNDCRHQLNGREPETDSRTNEESAGEPAGSQTSEESADKQGKEKEKIVYESIISQMFNGEILQSVQCLTCKNVSTIKETFQDLSLPIPNKDDLLQTRQANSYLKNLESSSFSSLVSGKQRLGEESCLKPEKVVPRSERSKKGKAARVKNGLKYRRLPNEEDGDGLDQPGDRQRNSNQQSVPLTVLSKLHKRLAKIPTIRYLLIFLLYINYFLRAYVLYSLLSVFYWSQANLWGPTITLNDCLDAFFSTDELKDNNMYSCEKCKKLRNGIKYTHLVKSPDILCIHFKRFRNELMFSSKISTYVSFPLKGLNISSHMMENPKPEDKRPQVAQESGVAPLSSSQEDGQSSSFTSDTGSLNFSNLNSHLKLKRKNEVYDLVSVICHRGHYNSGHYITYALNCLDECWYEYDDKSVRKVDENKVLNCEAYLLFFKRMTSVDAETTDQDKLRLWSGDEPKDERQLLDDCDEGQQVIQNETSNTQKPSFFRNSSGSSLGAALFGGETNGRPPASSLSSAELFRKRKYEKIRGELDYLNQTNDILGDLKL